MGRILVAEQAQTTREWLTAQLSATGHEVHTSTDGAEAITRVKDGRFDVVIAGLELPTIGGETLVRELKQVATDLAVILVCEPPQAARAGAAVKIGAYGFVQTPVDSEQLNLMVQRAIEYVTLLRENELLKERVQGVDVMSGKPLAEIEKQVILSTLQQFKGHRIRTAAALGIGVRTLGMKLKRWREEGQLIESRG